jgi:N-hydroxyarylamine O-acetyltransferase
MADQFDLEAYLARIGHHGPLNTDLATLSAIVRRHAQTIPFENIDPVLGREVRIDLDTLQSKLVRSGRGGYCFEQNRLLEAALHALGFRARRLAAQVLWKQSAFLARTHMLLLVEQPDGDLLADVGFGGMTLTGVLRLTLDIEQWTPHEPFRLVRDGEDFRLEVKLQGDWNPVYRFDRRERLLADYEVYNYFLSTNPASPFVKSLLAARPYEQGRYALLNNKLAVHHSDGTTERRTLTSATEMRDVLTNIFGIKLPGPPIELDGALDRLLAGPQPGTNEVARRASVSKTDENSARSDAH